MSDPREKFADAVMQLLALFSMDDSEADADYEARKIGRYEDGDLIVSTARVTDFAEMPYETLVAHPRYGGGIGGIIVEIYNTPAEAAVGHEKWVAIMTAPELPEALTDCGGRGTTARGKPEAAWNVFVRRLV